MSDGMSDVDATQGWPGELDPNENFIVSAFGRKGSGKTVFLRSLYRDFPYDKVCIDVNGDADPGPDSVPISAPLPTALPPRGEDKKPVDLHYVPDPGSLTYRDDLDRAVGMAMFPSDRRTLVWADEIGEFTNGNKTGPHLRRLLMQSRHYETSALFSGPRPMDIDKLVIGQADLVAVYDMPDPDDRDRVAKVIGYPPVAFREACEETFRRGPYWHLLWVSAAKRLYRCPPLPNVS
jgi:hypothetical protein